MSFFVPGSWNSALPGSISQPLTVGAGIATAGTIASRWIKKGMPSFKKRLVRGSRRRWSRARKNLHRVRRQYSGKRMSVSGRGVTFEHDRQAIYRRKRMPKRKRRRWGRFKRKVHAVAEKGLGSRTLVRNYTFEPENKVAGSSGTTSLSLYGLDSNLTRNNDINVVYQYENTADATQALGGTVYPTTKFFFQSAVLDVTIRNISEYVVSTVPTVYAESSSATLEVDIYEMTVGRNMIDQTNAIISLEDMFTKGEDDTLRMENAGDACWDATNDRYKRGSTPWECCQTLSRWRVKIFKKTKFFIRPGATITYQRRDPKRHVLTGAIMDNTTGANKPGLTTWLQIVFKVVPGFTVGESSLGQIKEKLAIGVTRKYMYKVEGFNERRNRWSNA